MSTNYRVVEDGGRLYVTNGGLQLQVDVLTTEGGASLLAGAGYDLDAAARLLAKRLEHWGTELDAVPPHVRRELVAFGVDLEAMLHHYRLLGPEVYCATRRLLQHGSHDFFHNELHTWLAARLRAAPAKHRDLFVDRMFRSAFATVSPPAAGARQTLTVSALTDSGQVREATIELDTEGGTLREAAARLRELADRLIARAAD